MTVLAAVRAWFEEWQTHERSGLLVGASGGADSTALALALHTVMTEHRAGPSVTLVLAHFNHNTRSAPEHAHDLAAVRRLSQRIGAPLLSDEAPPGAIHERANAAGGSESAARDLRHAFLRRAARMSGCDTICTAHTADDQAETVLMRLMDAMESTLLAGIPPARAIGPGLELERPLLCVSRRSIERFLNDQGGSWVEDRTNTDPVHRRNFVRHRVLPALETHWPAVRRDLLALAAGMRRLRERAERTAESVEIALTSDGETVERATVARDRFFALDREARLEVLYRMLARTALLDRCDRPSHRFFAPLLGEDPGRQMTLIEARGIRVGLDDQTLVMAPAIVPDRESGYLRTMMVGVPVEISGNAVLTLTCVPDAPGRTVVQSDRIKEPVVVRSPRPGDCMVRSGVVRTVSALLASAGVSRAAQRTLPLVVDRCGIVAVLGSVHGHRDVLRDGLSSMAGGLRLTIQSRE